MSKALAFVSSSFSTFSVSLLSLLQVRRRGRQAVSGMLMGRAGTRFHVVVLHGFCRHHSFWPLYFMSLTRRRLLSVTANSDAVMHFSTVFFFINVSWDVRCAVVMHEGLLKVTGGFSRGGAMMLCWNWEVTADLLVKNRGLKIGFRGAITSITIEENGKNVLYVNWK